ncbi:MAG: Maf family protein [Elusimicrobiota bacterium]
MPLILASRSPRRKKILEELGIPFRIIPSAVSEKIVSKGKLSPAKLVKILALRKAQNVASRLKEGLVLGADTVVVLRGKIIGKPEDEADARKILGQLSGSLHWVYTGLALIKKPGEKKIVGFEKTRVLMRKFSGQEIKKLAGKHLDKAGAYAIQESEDQFVEKIEGDYNNVVGLPVKKLQQMLRKIGE